MPTYSPQEIIDLLDSGKCGTCGGVLVKQPLRDRIATPQGDAFFDRGEILYCGVCKLYWSDEAIEGRRVEAQRIRDLSGG